MVIGLERIVFFDFLEEIRLSVCIICLYIVVGFIDFLYFGLF